MMLKFGRVIDLEQLENVSVNKLAEELQRKIKEQEKSANKELTHLKVVTTNNSTISYYLPLMIGCSRTSKR